ncbi:MAG TPA: hypothetical protein VJ872_06410 [Nocardioides sp.]|nr:hypothetical protein [Nocardioides sp.]
MTRPLPFRRALTTSAATLLAGGLAVASTIAPAHAAPILAIAPARVIQSDSASLMAITDNGTIYNGYGPITVLAPDSDGTYLHVLKTFTGMSVAGQKSYLPSAGLAWADSGAATVTVMDPSQAGGAFVATRVITGANTEIESPAGVAWASDGSLWVVDTKVPDGLGDTKDGEEFLRFAPGADGNVAPVQVIGGDRTGFVPSGTSSPVGGLTIAPLPNHGLAVSAGGLRPGFSVFTGSQSGNVRPAHVVNLDVGSPSFISAGITADAQGRIYIGTGDVHGNYFGKLDVYSSTGTQLLELGGARQNFRLVLAPAVSPNGALALVDGTITDLSGTTYTDIRIDVFKPLFAKPGVVRSLKVTPSRAAQTVSWLAPANPGGTPPSYAVVVKQGARTVLSKRVSTTRLAIARSALPKGSLKVTVTAVNIGGSGPGASRTFTN